MAIRIGVIGYGYWGPNLVRNFSELEQASLVAVSDTQENRLEQVRRRYPSVVVTTSAGELIARTDINAVAIATPVSTHFNLALAALRAGKHVLIEKPITDSAEKAQLLIEEAARRDLILMVDHTFVFSGAVRCMQHLVRRGRLGEIYYYDSVRVNLGLFQHDVDVLWDLAVHDLSIMDYVLGLHPVAVSTVGMAHLDGHPLNMAYLTCYFEKRLLAHFHVNWLAPTKIRNVQVCGSRRMIFYNDLEATEKIKVYDKGVVANGKKGLNRRQQLIDYRTGHLWVPKLDHTEALRLAVHHFLECIAKKQQPMTDGAAGLRIVRILEAATRSAGKAGAQITLNGTHKKSPAPKRSRPAPHGSYRS